MRLKWVTLKYDILSELLVKRGDKLEEIELSSYAKIFTLLNEAGNTAFNIAKYIPKLNKPIKAIELLQKGIETIEKKISNAKTKDSDDIEDFGKHVENQATLKNDDVLDIISKLLCSEEGVESVLIIDDLDRIDPDHIFRILNIFSAHIDFEDEEENKFGFNKIILVCDINNLRNIFHAKYGQPTDFSGYIDKFYVYSIFEFDNRQMLEGFTDKFLQSITIIKPNNRDMHYENFFTDELFTYLILIFIRSNALSIRRIKIKFGSEYNLISQSSGIIARHEPIQNWQITAYILFQYLLFLLYEVKLYIFYQYLFVCFHVWFSFDLILVPSPFQFQKG